MCPRVTRLRPFHNFRILIYFKKTKVVKTEAIVLGKIAGNESMKTKSKPQRGLQLSLFEAEASIPTEFPEP